MNADIHARKLQLPGVLQLYFTRVQTIASRRADINYQHVYAPDTKKEAGVPWIGRIRVIVSQLTKEQCLVLIFSLLFAGMNYQWLLYSSNQSICFLPGLVGFGYGFFAGDWLVQQTDAVPVFTILVKGINTLNAPWLFHICKSVFAAIYALFLYLVVRKMLIAKIRHERLGAGIVLFFYRFFINSYVQCSKIISVLLCSQIKSWI